MERLSIEFLSALGLPPVECVKLAADLGCGHISAILNGSPVNPTGYPAFDLRQDGRMRAEMIAALRDRGVSISLGEGFMVRTGADIRDSAGDLAWMRELGVMRVNVVSLDPDLGRTFDQYALFAGLAADAGMEEIVTEFVPGMTVQDLATALQAVRHVGRRDFRLLIDMMHFCRTGGTAAELAALDPDLIGYIHLCDAPMKPSNPNYMEEAMTERLAPGDGDFPLAEMFAVLPRDRVVGLEVPQVSKALAGVSPGDRLRPVVEAASALLDAV